MKQPFCTTCEFTFPIYNAENKSGCALPWQKTKPYWLFTEKSFPIILTAHGLSGDTNIPPVSKFAVSLHGGEESLRFVGGKSPFDHRLTDFIQTTWLRVVGFKWTPQVTKMPGRAETGCQVTCLSIPLRQRIFYENEIDIWPWPVEWS